MSVDYGTGTRGGVGADRSIEALNSLLRGELSAVETYRQALDKVEDTSLRGALVQGQEDHRRRAATLQQLVAQAGGEPATSSGAWGAFAKLVEGSAKVLGTKAAIAALEEGEDHGLRDYRQKLEELAPAFAQIVRDDLLSAQERSHAVMSALKRSLKTH